MMLTKTIMVMYRGLYFVDLLEIDTDGVEHWFDFVDVTHSMTCQVDSAILMIWRFKFTILRSFREVFVPVVESYGVLDKEDYFIFGESWSTCRCSIDITPPIHGQSHSIGGYSVKSVGHQNKRVLVGGLLFILRTEHSNRHQRLALKLVALEVPVIFIGGLLLALERSDLID